MNTFYFYASGFAGAYLIFLSFLLETENFRSTTVFKIVPFFLGLASLLAALKMAGIFL